MCTRHSDRSMMVCDVAIGRVRLELEAALGGGVRYTHVHGEGTLVDVDATVDSERFQELIQAAVAADQNTPSR